MEENTPIQLDASEKKQNTKWSFQKEAPKELRKMLWTSFSGEGREVSLAQRFQRGHGSLKWNVLFWCVIYAYGRVAWPSVARHAVSAAAWITAIHHNESDRKHVSASHSNGLQVAENAITFGFDPQLSAKAQRSRSPCPNLTGVMIKIKLNLLI